MPDMRPPPPIGTVRMSRFGSLSIISSPMVPCPAMMFSSLKGCMKVAPVFVAVCCAYSRASSNDVPWSMTFAPYPCVACLFATGENVGIIMVDFMPRLVAAYATPWAWFPALAAMTPAFLWFFVSFDMA